MVQSKLYVRITIWQTRPEALDPLSYQGGYLNFSAWFMKNCSIWTEKDKLWNKRSSRENKRDIIHRLLKILSYWMDFWRCFPTVFRRMQRQVFKSWSRIQKCACMRRKWVVWCECEWAFHTSWALLKIWVWNKIIILDAFKDNVLWEI
jgi:hypothetical protein